MKFIVLLVDGMADEPLEVLGGKTPLEVANIPTIQHLAARGVVGLVSTVPEGMTPGSDVANLSVMGYPPERFHSGRSPLEAASIGVPLKDSDVTFRANLVTLSGDANLPYAQRTMVDHSSGEITTEEAHILVESLCTHFSEAFKSMHCQLYKGVSYRHLLLWANGHLNLTLTPPHDILEKTIASYLPKGESFEAALLEVMEASYQFLSEHPINLERQSRGLNPANSLWFWGEGKKPQLEPFEKRFGIKGHVISAVDLIKGIGRLTGLTDIAVPGATGNLHTNFSGKSQAALEALVAGDDFSYIHLEAPDECGHQGDYMGKIEAIEKIDKLVLKPLVEGLLANNLPFRLLVVPDHPTPVRLRTHTREPVPYVLYDSTSECLPHGYRFTEPSARRAVQQGHSALVEQGHELMKRLTLQSSGIL